MEINLLKETKVFLGPLAGQRVAFLTQLAWEVRWYAPGRLTTVGMAFAKSYFRPASVPS